MPATSPIEQLTDVRDAIHGARRSLLAITVPADDSPLRQGIETTRHHLLLGTMNLDDLIAKRSPGSVTLTPGAQLRAYREAAGLTREDLALGLATVPVEISARSRAELIGLIEDGVVPISPEFLGELLVQVSTIAAAFIDRAPAEASAAA